MQQLQKITLAGLLSLVFATPVFPQSSQFDGDRLITLCEQGECVRGMQATVGQILLLRLPTAEFNSQLGIVASVLFQAASGANEAMIAQLSEAIRLLARFSTDINQRQSFIILADQLLTGEADLFDLESPFAVSPT